MCPIAYNLAVTDLLPLLGYSSLPPWLTSDHPHGIPQSSVLCWPSCLLVANASRDQVYLGKSSSSNLSPENTFLAVILHTNKSCNLRFSTQEKIRVWKQLRPFWS